MYTWNLTNKPENSPENESPIARSDDGTYDIYGQNGDYETYGPVYGKGSTFFNFFHFWLKIEPSKTNTFQLLRQNHPKQVWRFLGNI